MNFVYFSPHYPTYFWKFCHNLKKNGVNVLGIGDTPYDNLSAELKDALKEYYRVNDLENFDEVYRACGLLTHHHGKLDRIESHNEHWLLSDARLRTEFNMEGVRYPEVLTHRHKSKMKEFFKKAGVEVPAWCLPTSYQVATKFIEKVGYPVLVKPDKGVGATNTFKIYSDAELKSFFEHSPYEQYIMEQFITGQIVTFDGITSRDGEVILAASQTYFMPAMDLVNEDIDMSYHSELEIDPMVKEAGEKIAKAYNLQNTFFHFEFFRVKDKDGKTKIMALEVNMRPPGALITESMGYAFDTDVYKIWADSVVYGNSELALSAKRKYCVAYVGRKYRFSYTHSHEKILSDLGGHVVAHGANDPLNYSAMGNYYYIVRSASLADLKNMQSYIFERTKG